MTAACCPTTSSLRRRRRSCPDLAEKQRTSLDASPAGRIRRGWRRRAFGHPDAAVRSVGAVGGDGRGRLQQEQQADDYRGVGQRPVHLDHDLEGLGLHCGRLHQGRQRVEERTRDVGRQRQGRDQHLRLKCEEAREAADEGRRAGPANGRDAVAAASGRSPVDPDHRQRRVRRDRCAQRGAERHRDAAQARHRRHLGLHQPAAGRPERRAVDRVQPGAPHARASPRHLA